MVKNDLFIIKLQKINETAKRLLFNKYNTAPRQHSIKVINEIIYNENTRIVSKFKDYLIYDDPSDFLRRFYNANEVKVRLKKITEFYQKHSKIFPNYIKIQESKYIYKNIRRKQKIIDVLNEQKYSKDNKRRKHNVIEDLSDSSSRIFDTEIKDSIMKYEPSKNESLITINEDHSIVSTYNLIQLIDQTFNNSNKNNKPKNLIRRLVSINTNSNKNITTYPTMQNSLTNAQTSTIITPRNANTTQKQQEIQLDKFKNPQAMKFKSIYSPLIGMDNKINTSIKSNNTNKFKLNTTKSPIHQNFNFNAPIIQNININNNIYTCNHNTEETILKTEPTPSICKTIETMNSTTKIKQIKNIKLKDLKIQITPKNKIIPSQTPLTTKNDSKNLKEIYRKLKTEQNIPKSHVIQKLDFTKLKSPIISTMKLIDFNKQQPNKKEYKLHLGNKNRVGECLTSRNSMDTANLNKLIKMPNNNTSNVPSSQAFNKTRNNSIFNNISKNKEIKSPKINLAELKLKIRNLKSLNNFS